MTSDRSTTFSAENHLSVAATLVELDRADLARSALSHALTMDPNAPRLRYHLAQLHYEAGSFDDARQLLEPLRVDMPDDALTWLLFADLVIAEGSPASAQSFAQDVTGSKLPSPLRRALLVKLRQKNRSGEPILGKVVPPKSAQDALTALQAGRLDKAEAASRRLLKKDNRSPFIHAILGNALAAKGSFAKAEASFLRCIELDPYYPEVRAQLSRLLLADERSDEALVHLKHAVTLARDSADILTLLGLAYLIDGRLGQARQALHRAARLASDNPSCLAIQGRLELRVHRPDNALNLLKKAQAAGDHSIQTYRALAEAQAELSQIDDAMETLRAAAKKFPGHPGMLLHIVRAAQQFGAFDAAKAWLDELIQNQPNDGRSFYLYARLYRVETDDPYVTRMEEVFDQGTETKGTRVALAFGLSKVLEDRKKFTKAFTYMATANALSAEYDPPSADRAQNTWDTYRDVYDRGIPRPAATSEAEEPAPIFILGMPRSGTTLIEQIISRHSEVSPGGELGFADQEARAHTLLAQSMGRGLVRDDLAEVAARAADRYRPYARGLRVTDKQTNTEATVGVLASAFPNASFVVVNRDPRDACLSMFKNQFREKAHPYTQDLEALANRFHLFRDTIAYWTERLPERLIFVDYERMVAETEDETHSLIAACGLPWDPACLTPEKSTRRINTLSDVQARSKVYRSSLGGWRNYENELRPLTRRLAELGLLEGYET